MTYSRLSGLQKHMKLHMTDTDSSNEDDADESSEDIQPGGSTEVQPDDIEREGSQESSLNVDNAHAGSPEMQPEGSTECSLITDVENVGLVEIQH